MSKGWKKLTSVVSTTTLFALPQYSIIKDCDKLHTGVIFFNSIIGQF